MSGAKTMTLLAAGIALLCGAHFWLSTSPAASLSGGRRRALAPFLPSRIATLGVQRSGEKEVRLRRSGAGWRIEAPCAAAAEDTDVMRLVDAISVAAPAAEYRDAELARAGRTRADYGLEAPLVEVVAGTADGQTCDIVFGSAVPGGKGIFAAVAGVDGVFAMDGAVADAARTAAKGLRSRDAFALQSADVVSFDLKRGTERTMCFRKQGGIWKKLAGAEGESDAIAPGDAVEALLGAVCAARATGFVWPTGAPDEPAAATPALLAGYGLDGDGAISLVARGSRGAEAKIVFGGAAAAGCAYALVQDSSAVAIVPADVKAVAANADFNDARLFPAAADAISWIAVADGRRRYALSRGEDGGWAMTAPVAAAADREAANALAANVAALSQADLDSAGVAVSIERDGEPLYVSRRSLLGNMRCEDLRAKEMLRIAPGDIRRIALSVPGGEGEAVTEEAGALAELIAGLDGFRAARVVALEADAAAMKRFGLDNPQIVLAVDLKGEGAIRRNLLFGYREDGGGRYAAAGASDTVFAISPRAARRLEIERKRLEKKQ